MIEFALFGAGRIGQVHAASLAALTGARLRHVIDVDAAAAARLAQTYGATVVDTETALADTAVGAVLIASSTDTHADLLQRAAAAGKAVFCEKPIDLDLPRARACRDAARAFAVPVMLGFNRRFDPHFAELKRRLDAGEIGAPELLLMTSRDPAPPPAAYIARSGGIFRDMLIHDFDMFRWLLGEEAVSLHADGACLVDPAIGALGDIDTATVNLRTASGRLCQINASRRAIFGYDQRLELLGAGGMLQAGNARQNSLLLANASGLHLDPPPYFFLERYRQAYQLELAHFLHVLAGTASPSPGLDDGVKALELADAAARSFAEGRALRLEPLATDPSASY